MDIGTGCGDRRNVTALCGWVVKNLDFAPYDPGWREVLFSLLDHYWHGDREGVALTLDYIRRETGDPALVLELASAWFAHVIDLTPGVVPVLHPDGTPVLAKNGEPVYREVAPT